MSPENWHHPKNRIFPSKVISFWRPQPKTKEQIHCTPSPICSLLILKLKTSFPNPNIFPSLKKMKKTHKHQPTHTFSKPFQTPNPKSPTPTTNHHHPTKHTFVSWLRQSHLPSLGVKWYKKLPKWGKVQDHFSMSPAWSITKETNMYWLVLNPHLVAHLLVI